MQNIEISQVKKLINKGYKNINVQQGEFKQKIYFNKIKVGYGQRTYFICPSCGCNAVKLYFNNKIYSCVRCCTVKPYKGIQNSTKGGEVYLQYKMERFALKCGIGDFEYPFNYLKHPKPKGKNAEKWNRNLKTMQALENMRFQSIIFNTIWNPKVIQSVLNFNNKYLMHELSYLKRYTYPFESGIGKE